MDCIDHTGYLDRRGYGQKKHKGKVVFAHRLALANALGLDVFTMGGVVMHTCDNPACVNPDHLVLGTHELNMLDMRHKEREYCKLSLEQADEIRVRFVPAVKGVNVSNTKALAAEYNVNRATIVNVVTGKSRVRVK